MGVIRAEYLSDRISELKSDIRELSSAYSTFALDSEDNSYIVLEINSNDDINRFTVDKDIITHILDVKSKELISVESELFDEWVPLK